MAISQISVAEFFEAIPLPHIQFVDTFQGIELYLFRTDQNHPLIQGNKLYKLKYNLLEATKNAKQKLLTFGGAYSNHILAVAAAGKTFGFETVGIIRGEELEDKPLNSSLQLAKQLGMNFHFVTREAYRDKSTLAALPLYADHYVIPEGGSNALAVKGVSELFQQIPPEFQYIASSIGTGGTCAGILKAAKSDQQILGFSALKNGSYLLDDIRKHASVAQLTLIQDYHFGGYGKFNPELIKFVQNFHEDYQIWLEPIYTGKMMFGIMDMIQKFQFPQGSKILAVHTGGLQVNQSIQYD